MKVIISAGGTGGHIYPALAIINKIKSMEPDSEFLYIGTHNRMEKEIVPKNNIPFQSIEIYGFNRKNILKNFKTINCLFKSYRKCKKIIKEFNPDVVIGVGGYVTVPVILAANKLGYKTVIHEQNSVPGASNEFLAKRADLIMVSFSSSSRSSACSIGRFPIRRSSFSPSITALAFFSICCAERCTSRSVITNTGSLSFSPILIFTTEPSVFATTP